MGDAGADRGGGADGAASAHADRTRLGRFPSAFGVSGLTRREARDAQSTQHGDTLDPGTSSGHIERGPKRKAPRMGRLRLNSPARRGPLSGVQAYSDSKLAVALFTRSMAHRLGSEAVTCNCIHPGIVSTGIGQQHGIISRLMHIGRRWLTTPDEASEALVKLACSPENRAITGQYFDGLQISKPAARALDDNLAQQLWDHTLRTLDIDDPFSTADAKTTSS